MSHFSKIETNCSSIEYYFLYLTLQIPLFSYFRSMKLRYLEIDLPTFMHSEVWKNDRAFGLFLLLKCKEVTLKNLEN